MAQSVKCLLPKYEDFALISGKKPTNPSTGKVQTDSWQTCWPVSQAKSMMSSFSKKFYLKIQGSKGWGEITSVNF